MVKRRGILTQKQISGLIKKNKFELEQLEKVSKIQKKFQTGFVTGKSRSTIKRRFEKNVNITPEAKKKLKIFKIKDPKGKGNLFVPAIPKGIKIQTKKRTKIL